MEIWKDLIYQTVNYSDRFEISNKGHLRNKITGTLYKLSSSRRYLTAVVSLGSKKNIKAIRIHRAVAETFIPNPLNLP